MFNLTFGEGRDGLRTVLFSLASFACSLSGGYSACRPAAQHPHPPCAGLSLLFPTIKSNILESWSYHTVIQGGGGIATRFSSFLHPPQAAPTTRDLAQAPEHTQSCGWEWRGREAASLSGPHLSLSQAAHQPVSPSPQHLTEDFGVEDPTLYPLDLLGDRNNINRNKTKQTKKKATTKTNSPNQPTNNNKKHPEHLINQTSELILQASQA